MDQKEWFAAWFDTEYYHILYKHRDKQEAARFIGKLCEYLEIEKGTEVLDLACGMGRHSVTLHKLGYKVVGADLSANSIEQARRISPDEIEFIVHDMREEVQGRQFEVVFNLFTSFGYFDDSGENEKVLQSVHKMLNPGGKLVIDFLNARKVECSIEPETVISRSGIDFHVTKRITDNHIFKEIRFVDKGKTYHFVERVQALKLEDFKSLLESNGFDILSTFGDLDLNEYHEETSDRLILIAKKH